MSAKRVDKVLKTAAVSNPLVQHRATLFKRSQISPKQILHSSGGRIQVHRGAKGREIRMVGLRPLAEGWRQVRTLICDATGDPVLLRAVWPQLRCDQSDWQQLPRGPNVRIRQIVDRTFSKTMIAVEGDARR